MRTFILGLMFLAVPALAVAQQADFQEEPIEARVQMEQTTPAAAVDAADAETVEGELAEVRSHRVVEEAAVQDGGPTTMRWWWLVGAIVVGGILVAVLVG